MERPKEWVASKREGNGVVESRRLSWIGSEFCPPREFEGCIISTRIVLLLGGKI